MQFVTLNVLTYIFRIIDSINFCQNDMFTEYHRNSLNLLPLDIYKLRQENFCFDLPEGK